MSERFGDDWIASTLGRRVEVKTSKGFAQRIARTAQGDVQAVGLWEPDANGQLRPAWFAGFERDAAGTELARRMPGGIATRWSRDAVGRPRSLAIMRGQDLLDRTDYHWAGLDRLVARSDARRGKTEYLHDPSGRLAGAQRGRLDDVALAESDGKPLQDGERTDRRYGKGGVLLEDAGTMYAYDAVGNVVQKRTRDGRT